MLSNFEKHLQDELVHIKSDGLYKVERTISSPQKARIQVSDADDTAREVINLCANNYLGLADHPDLIAVAKQALEDCGYGMASVRFICGTQNLHRALEQQLARFLEKDDAILYAACFDANGGLFEPLLSAEDAIVSDSLNHASIIDGIRLCKAKRYRYGNNNINDLEVKLKQARTDGARFIMIATDGVFSMDGTFANLPDICALAEKYEAQVMVDDCHATGFIGPQGKGTPAHFNVSDKVHILTGTLGKALGGAIGGYIAANQPVIDMLRQRSRPYLFSNSLPSVVAATSLKALELIKHGDDLRQQLRENASHWREGLTKIGFTLLPGEHPIIPIMLGEAQLAQDMASALYNHGVYVSGFFFPVVPKGQARVRTQMNARLTRQDLDEALESFAICGKELNII
ncbi:MAG: glycine C-acetyltransferase [Pseudomonadota bacterium]